MAKYYIAYSIKLLFWVFLACMWLPTYADTQNRSAFAKRIAPSHEGPEIDRIKKPSGFQVVVKGTIFSPRQPQPYTLENDNGRTVWKPVPGSLGLSPSLSFGDCEIDFSDSFALSFIPDGAQNTFTYFPFWNQSCNVDDAFIVRPIVRDHFHLNYEDPAISICEGNFNRILPDGSCEIIDPTQETRYVRTHRGWDILHLYMWDGTEKKPFDLKRIRIRGGESVRLCYKPVQEITGPWITLQPNPTTSPGIWACWDELPTGYWDLSQWAGNITEVKITGTTQSSPFEIDDIRVGVHQKSRFV